MYLNSTVSRVFAAAAVIAATATASMAQAGFSYSTTFTPSPITIGGGFTLAPTAGMDSGDLTPTTINLVNFALQNAGGANGTYSSSTNFTINLTITPDGGVGQTQSVTGLLTASATRQGGSTGTDSSVTFTMPTGSTPLVYNFGNGVVFTVANPSYTPFGPNGSATQGAISARVTSTSAVPEPSEYAAMGMAAMSLGGLMFRARRRSNTRRNSGVAAA